MDANQRHRRPPGPDGPAGPPLEDPAHRPPSPLLAVTPDAELVDRTQEVAGAALAQGDWDFRALAKSQMRTQPGESQGIAAKPRA